MPEMAVDFVVFHFEIGDRGLKLGIPIDQSFIAIDQPFFVKLHKDFNHGFGKPLIHGETLAAPVTRRTKPFQLVENRAA